MNKRQNQAGKNLIKYIPIFQTLFYPFQIHDTKLTVHYFPHFLVHLITYEPTLVRVAEITQLLRSHSHRFSLKMSRVTFPSSVSLDGSKDSQANQMTIICVASSFAGIISPNILPGTTRGGLRTLNVIPVFRGTAGPSKWNPIGARRRAHLGFCSNSQYP